MRIRMEEALRYLGAKEADKQSNALIEGAWQKLQRIADPRHRLTRVNVSITGERVKIADFEAESSSLALNLRGGSEAYLLAATLGAGVDREMTKLSAVNVAEAFALQAAAARALECFCDLEISLGGACAADEGDGSNRYALVDDRNAVHLFDVASRFHQMLGRAGNFVVDLGTQAVSVVTHAVKKGDAHGNGADIQILLADHLNGFKNIFGLEHG